jgi:hypothetical protein
MYLKNPKKQITHKHQIVLVQLHFRKEAKSSQRRKWKLLLPYPLKKLRQTLMWL